MDGLPQSAPAMTDHHTGIVAYDTPSGSGNGTDPVPRDASRRPVVDYLRLFWEQRRFLVRMTFSAAVIAAISALLIPNRYESTTRIMPPDKESGMGTAIMTALAAKGGSAALGAMAGDMFGIKSSGQLLVGVLRSRTVADRMIERFDLKKSYGKKHDEDARTELADLTQIGEDRKSGIVTITVTDRDKQRATAMARAYVDELNRTLMEVSTSAAHRERVFLEGRLKEVKQDLDQAARDFAQFASKNTAIDIKEQGKAMVEAAAQLQGELIARQSELSGLEQIYTPNNMRVRAVRARIAELQRQLQKIAGPDASMARLPADHGDGAYPSIREIPMLGVTYTDLMRRAKVQEIVYEMLTQQYELAKVQEVKETPTAKVLDSANVPDKKSFPPRLLIVLTSMLGIFALSALWVVARRRWEEVDARDPGKILAREVFQTVSANMPWAHSNGSRFSKVTQRLWVGIIRRTGSTEGPSDN